MLLGFFGFFLQYKGLLRKNCIPKAFTATVPQHQYNLIHHVIPFHSSVPEGRHYWVQATAPGISPLQFNNNVVKPANSLSACPRSRTLCNSVLKTLEQQGREEHNYQEKTSILRQIVREGRLHRDHQGCSRPRANPKTSTKS